MNVRFFYLAGEKKGLNAMVGGKKVKGEAMGIGQFHKAHTKF